MSWVLSASNNIRTNADRHAVFEALGERREIRHQVEKEASFGGTTWSERTSCEGKTGAEMYSFET